MHKYRVLMQDSVNGQTFSFAQFYMARGISHACEQAIEEYNAEKIIDVVKVD